MIIFQDSLINKQLKKEQCLFKIYIFCFNMHYYSKVWGSIFRFFKKVILLFMRDVLNGYKVIVNTYIVRKAFYFE